MPTPAVDWKALYELGFSLIPIHAGSKMPATQWARYQIERASWDEISAWARAGYNAGIVTGQLSGVIVLDLDSDDAIAEAERRGLPATLTVETARGRHVYLRWPDFKVRNKVKIFEGADVRADGGYVVAAGSTHETGTQYIWKSDPAWTEIADVPEWLLIMLCGQHHAEATPRTPIAAANSAYGQRALDQELTILRNASVGGRNHQLNRSAYALAQLAAGGEIDAAAAQSALDDAAIVIGLERQEIDRTIESGWHAGLREPRRSDQSTTPDAVALSPKRFVMPSIADIPPRPWIFGKWLMRGIVVPIVAPGGTGKSSLTVAMALSLASGKEFLGKTIWGGPARVWVWNLEDDGNELARQIAACSLHHGLTAHDFADRLFVNDAGMPLCTASKDRNGLTIHEPVNDALVAAIRARQIDVVIIDPFVASHRAEENDNGQINAVAEQWARVSREANCCVVLVHHSRKLAGQKVDAESARGASALINAARSVLVLNRMEKAEAVRFGISAEEAQNFIRVSNDKANRAPAKQNGWFRLVPLQLANGGPEGGDSVAVIERWTPPDPAFLVHAIDDQLRAKVQAALRSGDWRADHTALQWAGNAIVPLIGADLEMPADRMRVKALIQDMLSKRHLRIENRPDANRKKRNFITVGDPIAGDCTSPAW